MSGGRIDDRRWEGESNIREENMVQEMGELSRRVEGRERERGDIPGGIRVGVKREDSKGEDVRFQENAVGEVGLVYLSQQVGVSNRDEEEKGEERRERGRKEGRELGRIIDEEEVEIGIGKEGGNT
ncbi:hypothetical protein L873DRAFT_1808428 [Choiromyces venosus 120613-1]|uniref:Uncharacterized protein n=1 Tax=Choiromyces venosus 120613-1 TaxID=1336337 RepID=A0A3N4JJI2_9PEZI|nr:hypothetical protein L873DRAFT_1808428 [Choiromyces venosus 120613-1]